MEAELAVLVEQPVQVDLQAEQILRRAGHPLQLLRGKPRLQPAPFAALLLVLHLSAGVGEVGAALPEYIDEVGREVIGQYFEAVGELPPALLALEQLLESLCFGECWLVVVGELAEGAVGQAEHRSYY